MSRGIHTRRDAADALRTRLLSELGTIDWWTGSFVMPDEFVAKMLDARLELKLAVSYVTEAMELMPEEPETATCDHGDIESEHCSDCAPEA